MPPDGTTTIAKSPEDLRAKVQSQVIGNKPSFFKLEGQLPKQGRTDTPLAASEKMWVVSVRPCLGSCPSNLKKEGLLPMTCDCTLARRSSGLLAMVVVPSGGMAVSLSIFGEG